MMTTRTQQPFHLALVLLLTFTLVCPVGAVPGRVSAALPSASSERFPGQPSREALKWADAQLKKMSLDEKIGQMISVGINATFLNQESEAYRALRRQIEVNHVGGIILFKSPVYESVMLTNRMQQLSKYPLLISADLEAGAGMRFDDTVNFPWNMAVGATGNPDYARRQGEMTAREARALGVQQIFAPVADVNNNAANPVINVRSYGEDPADVARFVAAFVAGAQGEGVVSTAKHFPGHGDTAIDSHRGLPIINLPLARLNSIELVPFRAAIKANVGAVMTAHISLPQLDPTAVAPLPRNPATKASYTDSEVIVENASLPGTLSPVIGNLLRRDLGFEGIIVTDALDMSGLTLYFKQDEAAVRAVLAGADILLKPSSPDDAVRGLREAVRAGRLTESRIEESARRILAAKYDLGLVRQRVAAIDRIDTLVSSREAVELSREIARRAITLVRNDGGLLPLGSLKPDARLFNLVVTNGDDRLFISNSFVAEMARGGRPVETIVLDERSSEAEVRQALERAQGADLVIASLYGRVRSGQARSVGVPEPGARALAELIKRRAPLVGISFGNPYLLQNFPQLQTYLVAYGDMPSLQQAAARALLGTADITGQLPITLPSLYARGTGIQLKAQTRGTKATP